MKTLLVIPREESMPKDPDFQFFHRKVPAKQGGEALHLMQQAFAAVLAAIPPAADAPIAPRWFERLAIAVFDVGRRGITYEWNANIAPRRDEELREFEAALLPADATGRRLAIGRLLQLAWQLSRLDQLRDESRRVRADFHAALEGLVSAGWLERERADPVLGRLGR